MGQQRGSTLLEVIAVVSIIAFFACLAMLPGVELLNSARMSQAASSIADSISLSRQKAVGRYEQWRIRFIPNPMSSSGVVHSYVLESCTLTVTAPGAGCTNGWTTTQETHLHGALGLLPLVEGAPVETLLFDRTGQFLGSTMEIRICIVAKDRTGAEICKLGSTGRLVRVRGFSGFVEM